MRSLDSEDMSAGATSTDPAALHAGRSLRILHCVRSPVGGIFRHIVDLATEQTARGHAVGIICDSSTGGAFEEDIIRRIEPSLALGIQRFPMRRELALSDIAMIARLRRPIAALNPDVLHAHGSKGGAYARIVGTLLRAFGSSVARIYTPHGGSMHYDAGSKAGRVYFAAERMLSRMTDAFIFVSNYEAEAFASKVRGAARPSAIAYNGLRPEEFEPVHTATDAHDFLFIGMLRDMKGTDVLINALALIRDRIGRAPSTFIIGDGPDRERYLARVEELGLSDAVAFHAPMPARTAFRLARIMIVPSRNESLPYIVLEGIAAGVPMIATNVGGIPEIFGDRADVLVTAGDAEALADAMLQALADPSASADTAEALRASVHERFSITAMADTVDSIYAQVTTTSVN